MTSPPILTIDILRHGQTEAKSQCLYGATDVALSEHGKAQLQRAFSCIQQEPVSHIVSSPLQRCVWLANYALENSSKSIIATFEHGFMEMDFGEWEGENISELIKHEKHFQDDVHKLTPPQGEPFVDFAQRVHTTWNKYVSQHIQQGGHHVLITHGGVMRVLLGQVLQVPEQHLGNLFIPHAAWSRITLVEGEKPMLWFMNRSAE